jgi:Transposase DDE domain
VRVFPLDALSWVHGTLVSRLQRACKKERTHWKGLRLLAADKTTLTLPDSRPLWECFGAHKGSQGLGPVAVELCCLFDVASRAPLRFVYGKVCTSEHKLIRKLIEHLKKGDLLLLDSGFYYCATFLKILLRHAHFIIPSREGMRPKVQQKLAEGDYLCEIKDSHKKKATLTVRVVFVHRNGFRRRRLVTSLLDPDLFPASELARLYHMRWDIETFYRDFKQTLRATSWHCHTPSSFHQEIMVHMIALCLIRIVMFEAGRLKNLSVAQLSFARALTETRLFLKLIMSAGDECLWSSIRAEYVQCCARHRVDSRPGRQFSRDRQEYRRKSRGLEKRRRGRKPKFKTASPLPLQPETRKDSRGNTYLLS